MTFECLLHICTGEMHKLKMSWALGNSFFTTWEWLFLTDFIWMFMHNVQRADQTIQQLWWCEQDVENSSNNCPQYFYINSYMSIPENIGHWSLLTCWNSEGFASAETWSSWCFGPHPGSGTARTSVWMPGDPAAPTCTKWCRHGRHWALSNPTKINKK